MRDATPEEIVEEIYNEPRLKKLMANEIKLTGKIEHTANIAAKSVWYRLWKNEKNSSEQKEHTEEGSKCEACGQSMKQ